MNGQIISGKEISAAIKEEIRQDIARMVEQGKQPGLAVVLVGEDPASQVYVRNKAKTCEQLGMYSEVHRLAASTTESDLLALIAKLNHDPRIDGILVQLPLPEHINEKAVIGAIAVDKDVDGFHPINVGYLMIGDDSYLPCTPAGVIEMLKRSNIELAGKHAVIVGRSNIVGKPVSMLLLREHATVTICHSRTANMESITKQADILVAAVGKAKMIKNEHVKPGAVIVDVGINRLADGSLAGDVDFDDVKDIAGWITPVPGGVGPMTIAMLMKNTLEAAKKAVK